MGSAEIPAIVLPILIATGYLAWVVSAEIHTPHQKQGTSTGRSSSGKIVPVLAHNQGHMLNSDVNNDQLNRTPEIQTGAEIGPSVVAYNDMQLSTPFLNWSQYPRTIFRIWFQSQIVQESFKQASNRAIPTTDISTCVKHFTAICLEGMLFTRDTAPNAAILATAWALIYLSNRVASLSYLIPVSLVLNVLGIPITSWFWPCNSSHVLAASSIILTQTIARPFINPNCAAVMNSSSLYFAFDMSILMSTFLINLSLSRALELARGKLSFHDWMNAICEEARSKTFGTICSQVVIPLSVCSWFVFCFKLSGFLCSCIGFARLIFADAPSQPTFAAGEGGLLFLPILGISISAKRRTLRRVDIWTVLTTFTKAVPQTVLVLLAVAAPLRVLNDNAGRIALR